MHVCLHNPRDDEKMVPGTQHKRRRRRRKKDQGFITAHFPSMPFCSICTFHKSVPAGETFPWPLKGKWGSICVCVCVCLWRENICKHELGMQVKQQRKKESWISRVVPWTFSIKSFPRILTIKQDGCLKPGQKALITPGFCLSFNASPKLRFGFVQQKNESRVGTPSRLINKINCTYFQKGQNLITQRAYFTRLVAQSYLSLFG